MKQLVFLLEEPSARALLEQFLEPRMPQEWQVRYVVFEGKQDLENNLVRRLRGWRAPNTAFVVLRDQDAADCEDVKARLVALVAASGRSALVRVACRDLESWILGDLDALAEAFEAPRVAELSTKARFRDPDRLVKPVEELRRLVPSYQKIDGARRVGRHLDPSRSRSRSFRTFVSGVERLWSSRS
ncbi:MAG: DUF4276 family protein [Planctomycetaceae bacterium]|jgi:hypothetical protein|nr:DUF4276 family protein [Planctomycetaceae bacterium]